MPDEIGWGEAIRLIKILRADPDSMFASAAEGWDYPLPRTAAVLMDLYDLEYAKTGAKNRKPYPRPYKQGDNRERRGNSAGRTPTAVISLLRPA